MRCYIVVKDGLNVYGTDFIINDNLVMIYNKEKYNIFEDVPDVSIPLHNILFLYKKLSDERFNEIVEFHKKQKVTKEQEIVIYNHSGDRYNYYKHKDEIRKLKSYIEELENKNHYLNDLIEKVLVFIEKIQELDEDAGN